MTLRDRFGNPVSTSNARAVELYDRAVEQFGHYHTDLLATLDAAIAADPTFVMAHAFKAGLFATTSERGAEPGIRAALEAAAPHAARATERERMHLEAARAWLARDFAGAVKRYGDIVVEHPRDLAALQIAHIGDFFLGQATLLRDRPAQARDEWRRGEPGYAQLLGMHAFGLEECGDFAAAEAAGREAVALDPRDGWAAHAVAHVMEMQARRSAGIDFLTTTSSGWSEQNAFAFHLWWHLALYRLDEQDAAGALALYDTRVRPATSTVALEMIDATALLWRMRLRGVDVGARWQALASAWEGFADDAYYAFNDVHALMAFLAAGRDADTNRAVRSLEAAARRDDTNGTMARDVGLPIARALRAFESGAYEVTIDELSRVRGIAQRFGGSHAQRDLLNLTLLEAAHRSGRKSLVRALTAERQALRRVVPTSRFASLRAA